jgi:hypothetical protein
MLLTPAQVGFLAETIPGFAPEEWKFEMAGQAGSDRRFVRVQHARTPDKSYVLMIWNSNDNDWQRFLNLGIDLAPAVGLLPHIYFHDTARGLILEEDLGSQTLNALAHQHKTWTPELETVYCSVLESLVLWQKIDPRLSTVIASRAMDEEMFLWESDYFATHCVTEYFGCDRLLDTAWDAARRKLAHAAAGLQHVCIHRDFQSENIMIRKGSIRYVDFQGARLGPAGYDLASLLYDPYIDLIDSQTAKRLLDYYRSMSIRPLSDEKFGICALQRLMQALGAYGNLSIHKGKERYRAFIPIALRRLHEVAKTMGEYPAIETVAAGCVEKLQKS